MQDGVGSCVGWMAVKEAGAVSRVLSAARAVSRAGAVRPRYQPRHMMLSVRPGAYSQVLTCQPAHTVDAGGDAFSLREDRENARCCALLDARASERNATLGLPERLIVYEPLELAFTQKNEAPTWSREQVAAPWGFDEVAALRDHAASQWCAKHHSDGFVALQPPILELVYDVASTDEEPEG